MEDVATAEISRSQIWQWIHRGTSTSEGDLIDVHAIERWAAEEGRQDHPEAWEIFSQVALGPEFVEFLTLPAYQHLP